jgi:hypothetical protein
MSEETVLTTYLLLVTANDVPSSLIFFILMMEAIRSSETSVLKRATQPHTQEDDILHSHRHGNLNVPKRYFLVEMFS